MQVHDNIQEKECQPATGQSSSINNLMLENFKEYNYLGIWLMSDLRWGKTFLKLKCRNTLLQILQMCNNWNYAWIYLICICPVHWSNVQTNTPIPIISVQLSFLFFLFFCTTTSYIAWNLLPEKICLWIKLPPVRRC